MAVTVEIDGLDRSTKIDRGGSAISFELDVNGQGAASFVFADVPSGFVPDDGMAVVISEDGTVRFTGIINKRPRQFLGPDGPNQLTFYKISTGTHEITLNKRRIFKKYDDVLFENIVADWLTDTNILSGEGVTLDVTAGTKHTVTFNGERCSEALDILCELEADGRTWRMNPVVAKQLIVETLAETATPVTLDVNTLLGPGAGVAAPSIEPDRSSYANRVTVIGGGPDLPITYTAQDAAEIAARAAAEGGTGIYHYPEEVPEAKTAADVQASAEGILEKRKLLRERFTGTTDTPGFAAGQQGDVNLPNLGISSLTMYVESVRTHTDPSRENFIHTVAMITGDPDGGWQSYYRREKKKPRTIPMQIEATPGLVRVESTPGPLVHDPPEVPAEFFQGAVSGALDQTPAALGMMHRRISGAGSGNYLLTLRRGGAANTGGCAGGKFPGYASGAACFAGRQTILEKWWIDENEKVAQSVYTGFSWDELAATATFKTGLVVSPDNSYAAFIQYGTPSTLGIVHIAGAGFIGSVSTTIGAQGNPGEPIWIGDYIYWPNVSNGDIFIYDVTSVDAPIEVGAFTTSLSAVFGVVASSDGNSLYAVGTGGIVGMSLTDKEAPGPSANSGSLSLDVASGAGTITRAAGSFLVDGFAVGQTILGSGFANAGNNTYFTIDTVIALVVTVTDATGMVTESGSGDEQLDAIEDSKVVTTGGYVSFDIEEDDTLLVAATRIDASNVRFVTIDVASAAVSLNTEASIALVTTALSGVGMIFHGGAAMCFSGRNQTGANTLRAHVFDTTDPAAVTFTETLSFSNGAAGNIGPIKTTVGIKCGYSFNFNANAQITYGIEKYDEVVPYTIDNPLRVAFGGTGLTELVKGNVLAASGRETLLAVDPPGVDDEVLISDRSKSGGVKWAAVGSVAAFMRGFIDGLETSNAADADHDITFATGACADSLVSNDRIIELSAAITKRIDAAWAAGDTNGGMATGSVAADTEYHLILIEKDLDDTVDAMFDVSATGANVPVGWTARRRIGSVFTDGSSNIRGYIQVGDLFRYTGPPLDVNDSGGALGTFYTGTLSVPAISDRVVAIVMPLISVTSTTTIRGYIKPTDTGETLSDENTAVIGYHDAAGSTTRQLHFKAEVLADSSAQIEYGVKDEGGGTWGVFRISTVGWYDPRGRDA